MKYIIYTGIIILVILAALAGYLMWVPANITISATPADSQIYIDGSFTGTGTATKSVKKGVYNIEVKLEKYSSIRQRVKVKGGQKKQVDISLIELPTLAHIEDGVTTAALDEEKKNLLISGGGGKTFYKYFTSNGEKKQISKLDIGKVIKTKWSPNKYLTFIWKEDKEAGLVDLKRYDLVNQSYTKWGKGYLDLTWSSDGKKVAFIYQQEGGEFTLRKSDPDRQNNEVLFNLQDTTIKAPYLEWTPNDKKLVIIDKDIYVYTIYTHEWQKITNLSDVLYGRLAPDGKSVAYVTEQGTFITDLGGKSKRLGEKYDSFSWLPKVEMIVGYRNGSFSKMNMKDGQETALGYNGKKIEPPNIILLPGSGVAAYMLINNNLEALRIQAKIIFK